MKLLQFPYNVRYGRIEYIGKFGIRAFWYHIKGLYIFRRLMKDNIVKALYLAFKYAGTL